MYRVSVASSSGAGGVPGAVGDAVTGCCSGCGGAVDMMETVDAKEGAAADHRTKNRGLCFHLDLRPLQKRQVPRRIP